MPLWAFQAQACRSPERNWKPEVWAGNSAEASIDRGQSGETVKCTEPKFDSYLCMRGPDFIYILNECLGKKGGLFW